MDNSVKKYSKTGSNTKYAKPFSLHNKAAKKLIALTTNSVTFLLIA